MTAGKVRLSVSVTGELVIVCSLCLWTGSRIAYVACALGMSRLSDHQMFVEEPGLSARGEPTPIPHSISRFSNRYVKLPVQRRELLRPFRARRPPKSHGHVRLPAPWPFPPFSRPLPRFNSLQRPRT